MDQSIDFLPFCFANCWLTGDLFSFFIWFIFYSFKCVVPLHLTAILQCDFKFEIEPNEMRYRGLRFFYRDKNSCCCLVGCADTRLRKFRKYIADFLKLHLVCVSPYHLLKAWPNLYETWYIYHSHWAHLSSVLHKSLPPACMSLCISVLLW
jgi:hypothetical protein